jgi:hypothetical protein
MTTSAPTPVRIRFTDGHHELVASAVLLDGGELRFLLDDEVVERWPAQSVDRIEWLGPGGPSLAERRREAGARRLGERWTPGEDDELRQEHAAGRSIPAMAAAHQRNPGGIRSRLVRLGLLDA